MIPFSNWLNKKQIDESQIDAIYNKAKIAVELVQQYNPQILMNVSTIANLSAGAYGLYNSGENQDILDPTNQQKIIIPNNNDLTHKELHNPLYQRQILKQYYPQVDSRHIKHGDTIHVNVRRIISQFKNDYDAILQISSTICHEATHANEFRQRGNTSEIGPVAEEHKFMKWATNPQVREFINKKSSEFK